MAVNETKDQPHTPQAAAPTAPPKQSKWSAFWQAIGESIGQAKWG